MKIRHSRTTGSRWPWSLAVLLLTLSEAHGQSSGAAAAFEGRPAMAGAQAGQGARPARRKAASACRATSAERSCSCASLRLDECAGARERETRCAEDRRNAAR